MDLPFLTTLSSEYKKSWTGTHFTVRSANSPSYSLIRRPGVRNSIFIPEEKRESAEETGESDIHGTHAGTANKEHSVAGYQVRTGSQSNVKGQYEMKEKSTKLDQNGTKNKTMMESGTDENENTAFESCGRTETRKYNLSKRSFSLDLRTAPDCSTRADISTLSSKGERELEDRWTGVENLRGRVMPSVQPSAGLSNVQERNSLRHLSHTVEKTSRGHSFPSRLRSDSSFTASSFGPKGGQSILQRIEKLYGSAGFSKTESYSKIGDSSSSASIPDFTWIPQKDTSGFDSSLSAGKSRRLSGGQWQDEIQNGYSEEGGLTWSKGLEEIGTRSLDRARSRNTVAAQIQSARAAGGFTAHPKSATSLEETGLTKNGTSEGIDQSRGNHRSEKGETKRRSRRNETENGVKDKGGWRSISIDEDVFESNLQNNTLKIAENRNKFPNMVSVPSAASVRNKINQFEALSQRALSCTPGLPRRALSEPAPLSIPHDGGRMSRPAKIRAGLTDKWEEEKVDESEEKVRETGKNLWSARSLSVDGVGLRLGRKEEGNNLIENERKEMGSGKIRGEDFDTYNKLKSTLKIPLNEASQRQHINFYIDETDFSKASSPEETNKRDNFTPSLLWSIDTSSGGQQTPSGVTSPVSSEDKTPTNTPNNSPFLYPTMHLEYSTPIANGCDSTCDKTLDPNPTALPHPLASSSHTNLPDLISPDVSTGCKKGKKRVMDLNAWIAGLNSDINVWNDGEDDYEDDDESTQKDEDSNYDSDSGESSVTVTSNTSHKSFCVSLSDLCNFAGVEYESENDRDEWQSTSRRSISLSSDVSALSCVSVMPSEELDRLLEDVKSLGDNTLQDYDDVQVVVLHKEIGVGLGFTVAGGVDQNKPVTVHKVFHSGVAAQEGSIREGDQVLSINGTTLCGYAHWDALRVLRRAKSREMGVVVLRRGDVSDASKKLVQRNNQGPTQTQVKETGHQMCVRLEKNSRDLGFSLEGGVGSSLGNKPLTVQKIFQGGPVDKVCPGDEVLEVEGISMVAMSRLEAWTFIRKLPPGPVDVVLSRPLHLGT